MICKLKALILRSDTRISSLSNYIAHLERQHPSASIVVGPASLTQSFSTTARMIGCRRFK